MTLINQSGTSFSHVLRGQMALPMGGGTPRLYLLSTMVRSDWTAWQTVNPVNPHYPPLNNYKSVITCSTMRASISLDFGETFVAGVDVGMEAQVGGALADGRSASLSAGYNTEGIYNYAFSAPDGPTHIVPQSLIVTPNGRVFVRAFLLTMDPGYASGLAVLAGGDPILGDPTIYSSPDELYYSVPASERAILNESYSPRICDNVFLRAPISPTTGLPLSGAFRNAATINQGAALGNNGFVTYGQTAGARVNDQVPAGDFKPYFEFMVGPNPDTAAPSMAWPVWQSAGAAQATKGGGAKVRMPALLYTYACDAGNVGHYYSSADGGDTWQAETGLGSPFTGQPLSGNILFPQGPYSSGIARDHTRPCYGGWFDNGLYGSWTDSLINSPFVWVTTSDVWTVFPSAGDYNWGFYKTDFSGPIAPAALLYAGHPATSDGYVAQSIGTPISAPTPVNTPMPRAGQFLSADSYTDTTDFTIQYGIPDAVLQPAQASDSKITSGGLLTNGGDSYYWAITAADYEILGSPFTSSGQNLTPAAADADFDRIDLLYLDSSGAFGVIEGTPGPTPAYPLFDPTTQLVVFAVLVGAGTTGWPGAFGSFGGWYLVPTLGFSGYSSDNAGTATQAIRMNLPAELHALQTPSVCPSIGSGAGYYPSQASDFAVVYLWGGMIVVVYGIGGVVKVLKSLDLGRSFVQTGYSIDNLQSWFAGVGP
jgi:hypothetical protein